MQRNFRKRSIEPDAADHSDDEDTRRVALEEIRYVQKLRERKLGIPADPSSAPTNGSSARVRGGGGSASAGEAGKEDLVLQDTFAQETAVTIEDPNMLKYVETQLAKKRGKMVDVGDKEEKDHVDELYTAPDHLKVKKKNLEESSTQWTTGIAEVQLPIEYKLRNIEETEAAKKMLQEKRLAGKPKSDANIPSSYSADYFHRGREHDQKLRREHPGLYKDKDSRPNENAGGKATDTKNPGGAAAGRREAASDELMLERFRKREKFRVMRR
ncbi:protein COP1 SUPPRESSOR 2-like [Phragmites australis]|uniref:protein COP1 SUPPRESSOR 2-like n=1 Tax=Phragmites australis TaxID=29695 RepID=UPI002D773DC0|nr:protein COP1 SUPPRESSOR 2-like [Phragmites australis]